MAAPSYRLGLPAWAFPGWRDTYFPGDQPTLSSYARVFTTVEGNTTFYRIPDADAVASWRRRLVGTGLKVCFKLPRTVTHESPADLGDMRRFLSVLEPMAEFIGPYLIQFPTTVGPTDLDAVDSLLGQLPRAARAAIEVRHPEFFATPALLHPLIERYELGRVVLDSRPIFEGDRSHPEVLEALHAKPELPVLPEIHNDLSLTRLILHPELPSNARYLNEWVERSAASIRDGIDTYMMIHCPNNLRCPPLARMFHEALCRQPGMEALAPLPEWQVPQQGSLI